MNSPCAQTPNPLRNSRDSCLFVSIRPSKVGLTSYRNPPKKRGSLEPFVYVCTQKLKTSMENDASAAIGARLHHSPSWFSAFVCIRTQRAPKQPPSSKGRPSPLEQDPPSNPPTQAQVLQGEHPQDPQLTSFHPLPKAPPLPTSFAAVTLLFTTVSPMFRDMSLLPALPLTCSAVIVTHPLGDR